MALAYRGTHQHDIHAVRSIAASHDAQLCDAVPPFLNPNHPATIVSLPTSSRGTSFIEDGLSINIQHPSSNKFELPIKPKLLSGHAVRSRQGERAVGTCEGREVRLEKSVGWPVFGKGGTKQGV